jgi:hypothetical protein
MWSVYPIGESSPNLVTLLGYLTSRGVPTKMGQIFSSAFQNFKTIFLRFFVKTFFRGCGHCCTKSWRILAGISYTQVYAQNFKMRKRFFF